MTISNGESGASARAKINELRNFAPRSFATPTDLRASGWAGEAWSAAQTQWPPRLYTWVDDDEFPETSADDIIIPSGHSGAGRWVYSPRWPERNGALPLPRLAAAQLTMTTDGVFRTMIIGDSITAKYTTQNPGGNFWNWMRRQFRENSGTVLSQAFVVTESVVGSVKSFSDDETVGFVGYYYTISDGETVRIREGGGDAYGDTVEVFYIQEPGAGELTVTARAQTSGETHTTTVDADGTRQSAMVSRNLIGTTGVGLAKRIEVELTASGGAVKVLPWAVVTDSTVPGKQLVYNRYTGRGGYFFDPDVYEANKAVLGQQIADFDPDLLIIEYADALPASRLFLDKFITDLDERDCVPDIVLVASPMSYQPGYWESDSTTQNEVEVDDRRLLAGYQKALAEVKRNVYFHDHGNAIKSQQRGQELGAYTPEDVIHPQEAGGAILIAEMIRCIPTYEPVRGAQYLQTLLAREIYLPSATNIDTADIAATPKITAGAAGDLVVEWKRSLDFKNWFNGSAETTARVDRFGVATKELRFTGSTSKLTSTSNGVVNANGSRLTGVAAGTDPSDAPRLDQTAKAPAATETPPTSGGTAGDMRYMTGPNRVFLCLVPGSWVELALA